MNLSKYVGIPYAEHGRGRLGCDCWGLVTYAYKEEFGISLPSYDAYYDDPENQTHIDDAFDIEEKSWQKVDKPVLGDVVLLKLRGVLVHVGIIIDSTRMLHVMKGKHTIIESYTSLKYTRRIKGFYRYAK